MWFNMPVHFFLVRSAVGQHRYSKLNRTLPQLHAVRLRGGHPHYRSMKLEPDELQLANAAGQFLWRLIIRPADDRHSNETTRLLAHQLSYVVVSLGNEALVGHMLVHQRQINQPFLDEVDIA